MLLFRAFGEFYRGGKKKFELPTLKTNSEDEKMKRWNETMTLNNGILVFDLTKKKTMAILADFLH